MSDKTYDHLLSNLRILSCIEGGDYVSIDSSGNIYCRWSANWWNTITSAVRLETWNQTYVCLQRIYCTEMPDYINKLKEQSDAEYKLLDLRLCAKKALVGLKLLKNVYSYAYQTKSGGQYDSNFDTLIDSYALIQLKHMKKLIREKEKERKSKGISYDSTSDEEDEKVEES